MDTTLKKPISIFKTLLDIVFPPVCYICSKSCSSKYGLCKECIEKIKYILPPYCNKCGRHLTGTDNLCPKCASKNSYIEKAFSCCLFEDTIKDCVHLFKYKGFIGLRDIFNDILASFVSKNDLHKRIDVIVPVPIHSAKKRERTYNHSELLARSLSKRFSVPIDTKSLIKIKWTRPQNELDKAKRLVNVKDTFLVLEKNAFNNKIILLVDDVFTTGSTANECARILLKAKAGKVFSLALARTD